MGREGYQWQANFLSTNSFFGYKWALFQLYAEHANTLVSFSRSFHCSRLHSSSSAFSVQRPTFKHDLQTCATNYLRPSSVFFHRRKPFLHNYSVITSTNFGYYARVKITHYLFPSTSKYPIKIWSLLNHLSIQMSGGTAIKFQSARKEPSTSVSQYIDLMQNSWQAFRHYVQEKSVKTPL